MNKTKSRSRKPRANRSKAPQNVDEYIVRVPEPGRGKLQELRHAIRSVVPKDATEIISYGIPAFRHTEVLVWYAAFSDHCSLFPKADVIAAFKDELKDFSTSKGTIHFPIDKPLPVALIKRIVMARVARANR